jgi:D-amino-acid dehydrogenase
MAWRIRRQVGIEWLELSADELRQREPGLDRRYGFAALVEEGGHCRDPGAYVAALVALAEAEGAKRVAARATGFRIEAGRLRAVRTEAGEIAADRAVISAGAHSKTLAAAAGDRVPLETERGYHAMIEAAPGEKAIGPRTPLMPSDGKMSITMTDRGLRCAGQVEIAGLEAAPNWRRAEILRDHLLRSFPGLPRDLPPERVKLWMGHRPSMPDGLPCIGAATATPDVVHAFGHGHVGLVAGPRTARLVAQMLGSRPLEVDASPYDPRRFH